jgi:hypothetical protein
MTPAHPGRDPGSGGDHGPLRATGDTGAGGTVGGGRIRRRAVVVAGAWLAWVNVPAVALSWLVLVG